MAEISPGSRPYSGRPPEVNATPDLRTPAGVPEWRDIQSLTDNSSTLSGELMVFPAHLPGCSACGLDPGLISGNPVGIRISYERKYPPQSAISISSRMRENTTAMKPEHISIFITASCVSLLAVRAVLADQFKNTLTDKLVLIGGIAPWLTVGYLFLLAPGWAIAEAASSFGLSGSGLIFFGALLRYWLGPRFDGWERASRAMMAAILAALGFHIAVAAVFFSHGR